MAPATAFIWHQDARLFAGDRAIARPDVSDLSCFADIPAQPTEEALTRLAAALCSNSGFCISATALPTVIQAEPGHFLTLTGGTSGPPKIIHRSHASWIASFDINATKFALTSSDSIAVLGRLSHSLALYGVLEAMHIGMHAHVLDEMRPAKQHATLAARMITVLYATPTQLRLLAQAARGGMLPSVRLILCGGGSLDAATRDACQTLCPNAALHVFYGAAETSFITLSDADTPERSVGRPYPGVTIRILDEHGHSTSGPGEIWVQSPYLFLGYLSGETTSTRLQDGFVTVGEIGRFDDDGQLLLAGRRDRMVSIADQSVFPETVETLISNSFDSCICAVLAVPDATRGHRLIAVLQGEQDAALAQAVKDLCHRKLGALRTPGKVMFHPSVPLLGSGKVDLIALSNWLEHRL